MIAPSRAAYFRWKAMHRRCADPASDNYHRYGGRGIKVCERWAKFENFLADMGHPVKGYSLDRIDNDGNYEPGNCHWATAIEQTNNTSANTFIDVDGVSRTMAQWSRVLGIDPHIIAMRLKRGWSAERAIKTPKQRYREPA